MTDGDGGHIGQMPDLSPAPRTTRRPRSSVKRRAYSGCRASMKLLR